MKRNAFSPPEVFSLSPLLTLLPVMSKVTNIVSLTSSLYARYEKVASLKRDLEGEGAGGSVDREVLRRFTAEESMLKQVLDWLEVKPQE